MIRRYYLKNAGQSDWDEVTKEQYVMAELEAGYRSTWNRLGEPVTGGFNSGKVQGCIRYESEENYD